MDLNAVMSLSSLMRQANHTAKEKGWWTCQECEGSGKYLNLEPCSGCKGTGHLDRNFGEMIALMHSELSECLEEQRNGHGLDEIYWIGESSGVKYNDGFNDGHKPEGIAVEFADVLIRIFDTCEELKIPLERALQLKMAYNKTRPYRHGGKKS